MAHVSPEHWRPPPGRAVATPKAKTLGFLVGHQRIVTGDGIRSSVTTTDRGIETDDTERYLVAPHPAPVTSR
jgi:hypothetical protein